ncbi:MAG: hypothetical protein JWN78_2889 [Bacteroidota bacterium]|nr:hypothetical protein [Bacteroidota bacterium]
MRIIISIILFFSFAIIRAQDSIPLSKNKILSSQSILLVKTKADSTQFITPKFRQGFFCNFEDQLNRKKVPVDFSLGKSKY